MGASGWHYRVPYDVDVGRALAQLRADVFARGDYYRRGKKQPRSIDHARELAAEDGTHSILDIDRVIADPLPAGRTAPADFLKYFGALMPLAAAQITEIFGSATPDAASAEAAAFRLSSLCPRGSGCYVVLYRGGAPDQLLIAGKSGD